MTGVFFPKTGLQRINHLNKGFFGHTHIFKVRPHVKATIIIHITSSNHLAIYNCQSQVAHRPTFTPLTTRATSSSSNDDDGDLLIERQLASKKKKDSTKSSPSFSSNTSGPKVITPIVDQVYSNAQQTPEQQAENAAVSFLGLLFLVILGEGVFLAGSGFFSEAVDQFAADVVYPAFSPTVIVFLACSSLYGLWKTGGLSGEDGDKKN
jgi:hypothetical protein